MFQVLAIALIDVLWKAAGSYTPCLDLMLHAYAWSTLQSGNRHGGHNCVKTLRLVTLWDLALARPFQSNYLADPGLVFINFNLVWRYI